MQLSDRTRRLFLCAAASAAVGPLLARAAASRPSLDIRVLVGGSKEVTTDVLRAFMARFPTARVVDAASGIEDRKDGPVYVALGAAALQVVLEAGATAPMLALFTSNEAYTRIIGVSGHRPALSALFAEASPLHQLKLVRAVYKRRIGVTALFSAATSHLQSMVEQAAKVNDVELHARVLDAGDNVVHALLSERDAQAVLMIPDRKLYTTDNLRNVLESAYRRRLGIIGFTPSLVRAGALGAAYSTIEDVLAQVGSVIEDRPPKP